MLEMVKGRNNSILRVIWTTTWIFWIHKMQFLKTNSSKSHGWILMKFSGNVENTPNTAKTIKIDPGLILTQENLPLA